MANLNGRTIPLVLVGTKVTKDGVYQGEWSADFAEAERQKSKNLLVYPYTNTTRESNGITFTDNGDGSITINGKNTGENVSLYYLQGFNNWTDKVSHIKVKPGTYTMAFFGDVLGTDLLFTLTDGTAYYQVKVGGTKTFTITKETSLELYLQVTKTNTTTYSNLTVYPILVSGTEVGDWQPYNGAIVHEKDIQKHIITARLESDFIFESSGKYWQCPIKVYESVGNKLSVQNDSVKIGSGVSKVKVSGVIVFNTQPENGYIYASIQNKTQSYKSYALYHRNGISSEGNVNIVIPPVLCTVQEGDEIILNAQVDKTSHKLIGSTSQNRTFITVEVVE